MASDPSGPRELERSAKAAPEGGDAAQELERLRELLLGKEQRELHELTERFDSWKLTPEEVGEQLPEAIVLRSEQDKQLGRALAPTLEAGIQESVSRNPQQIAQAIYPILGPAIRKAISETISGFVETLNRAIEHSVSVQGLKWRIEAWRTGVPYGEIVLKHALVYQVEQAFLIHAESGLLLHHVALDEQKSQDPDLVSGMLTAIRDFVGDSFNADASDSLRTFTVGGLTVMVASGPRALLAVVVRGQPPATLFETLNAALETIHLQLRVPLAEFEGDTEPFAPAEVPLAELLQTVVETDRAQTRSATPKIAWAVAGVVALVLVVLAVRASMRWNAAVTALRAEPGFTLIDADRGLRRWRFEGLLDPSARDPLVVLEENGLDPKRIVGHWEPYLSFDEPMVLARVTRRLEPPQGVRLDLAAGVLLASGTVSARWAMAFAAEADRIDGVSRIDLSGLEVTVPEDLADQRAEIGLFRVLFAVGSARLTAEAEALLDAVATKIAVLRQAAREVGYGVSVDIVGRTDSSGTEETNRMLSEQRAQAVLDGLVARGIDVERFAARGIGVTDPISGADDGLTAQANRSVSFVPVFSDWMASGDER